MIFFALVALVALLALFPYLLIAYKRKRMLSRVVRIATRSGFRVRKLHKFVCFSPNRGKKYDLLFECKNYAYAVKLWSATKKGSTLTIQNGMVSQIVSVPSEMLSSEQTRSLATKYKSVPVTRNNYKVRRGKPVLGVLLCYPPNKEIIAIGKAGRKKLSAGDKLFDKTIYFPGNFEGLFSKNDMSLTEAEATSNS